MNNLRLLRDGETIRISPDRGLSSKDMNLADILLLSGLEGANLTKLAPNFKQSDIESGEILFKQEGTKDQFYSLGLHSF